MFIVPGWGQWSDWTDCSQTCGQGIQSRNRTCDDPEPTFGGICRGNTTESKSCLVVNCPSEC